jgi:hypothetical protein
MCKVIQESRESESQPDSLAPAHELSKLLGLLPVNDLLLTRTRFLAVPSLITLVPVRNVPPPVPPPRACAA